MRESVKDQAHTNGIERCWARLKRGYHGTYHLSEQHLEPSVHEFAGRHKSRALETADQMTRLAQDVMGRRLPSVALTAAAPGPAGKACG